MHIKRNATYVDWNTNLDGLVYGVAVADKAFWNPAHQQLYHCHGGACSAHWLDGSPSNTPEGLFAILDRAGFASPDEKLIALDMFSMVEGCEWAETMYHTLTEPEE